MAREQLTWPQRGRLWLRLGIRLALVVLAVFFIRKLLPPLWGLFAPFILAFIAAALLNPLVKWVQRRLGWSRRLLTMLLLVLLFGLTGGGLFLLFYAAGNELVSLAQNWEGLLGQLQSVADQIEGMFTYLLALVPKQVTESARALGDHLMGWLQSTVSMGLTWAADYVKDKAIGVPAFFLALVIFVMACYFLTADYPYLRTRAIQHMDEDVLEFFGQVRSVAVAAFGGYLRAELLLSVGVFFILLGGFLLTRQSYALLLALALAVLDFIPIVGSGTVMVPWAVIAFITRDYPTAISVMVPAATFPEAPGTRARTGTSAVSSPAGMVPSSVVSKRISPAVMHTVPLGMLRASPAVLPAVKRTTPPATAASFRSSPRSRAWRSRYSPSADWGKACRTTQSAWT